MSTVLITGANRGLGLEAARQYAVAGWQVLATCRRPERARDLARLAETASELQVLPLDVTDFDSVDRLADSLAGTAIDLLLNNAGIFGPQESAHKGGGQGFGDMDYEEWEQVLRVNTLAPFKLAEAFVEGVAESQQKKIVTISSSMGSIGEGGAGYHAYRSSKAAVNRVMAGLAEELRPRGIVVVLLCPGWVQTDMGGPQAELTPEESVAGMCRVIDGLRLSDSGSFLQHDGSRVPW
jgi:NAD(P)-dependent dehydrogenase (short-subunit alcohol dehydrogenase family)